MRLFARQVFQIILAASSISYLFIFPVREINV